MQSSAEHTYKNDYFFCDVYSSETNSHARSHFIGFLHLKQVFSKAQFQTKFLVRFCGCPNSKQA